VTISDRVREEYIFSDIGAAGDKYESDIVRVSGNTYWSLRVRGMNAELVIEY